MAAMNLLNPVFLFALAAAALPLLIHLLSRRRVPEFPFSSLRFLRRSDRRSMRRITLRRLLLLVMRTAAVVLVVLAFARPVVEGRLASLIPAQTPRLVVVLLDRSYSMGVRESGGTLFDRAREAALEILSGLGPQDEVAVVLFDEAQELILAAERTGWAVTPQALSDARPSWRGTDIGAALEYARGLIAGSRHGAGEIFLVSDLQRSGMRGPRGEKGMPAAEVGPGAEVPLRVFLVPVAPDPGVNVAVVGVRVPRAAVHRGEMVAVRAVLRSSAPGDVTVPVRVEVDGRRIVEQQIDLPPGAEVSEEFRFEAERSGWIRGSVSCREDRLPADDSRRFTIAVRERARVLLLSGGDVFYLEQALEPEGAEGDIALDARLWSGYESADLRDVDVVVAGSAGAAPRRDAPILRRFAETGGRVVVFVAPGLEEFAAALSAHGPGIEFRPRDEGFLEPRRPPAGSGLFLPFGREDLDGFSRLRLRGAPTISGIPAREVLARLSDGSPLVWREEIGAGEAIFVAADPDAEGGNLVLSPYFLPLVQQLVLARIGEAAGTEGALVGGSISIPVRDGKDCSVRRPGEELYRPAARRDDASGTVVVPAGGEPGFLVVSCGEEWEIAVNPDCRRESILEYMSADEAADSLGLSEYGAAPAGPGIAAAVREAREGKEIAGMLAAAALLLLAGELAVAQFGGGRGDGDGA